MAVESRASCADRERERERERAGVARVGLAG